MALDPNVSGLSGLSSSHARLIPEQSIGWAALPPSESLGTEVLSKIRWSNKKELNKVVIHLNKLFDAEYPSEQTKQEVISKSISIFCRKFFNQYRSADEEALIQLTISCLKPGSNLENFLKSTPVHKPPSHPTTVDIDTSEEEIVPRVTAPAGPSEPSSSSMGMGSIQVKEPTSNFERYFPPSEVVKIRSTADRCREGKKGKPLFLFDLDGNKQELYIRKKVDGTISVVMLESKPFAEGSFGEVTRSPPASSSGGVAKKMAKTGSATREEIKRARKDVEKEYKLLKYFAKNGGGAHHIQARPFSAVRKGLFFKKTLLGYYGELYENSCFALLDKVSLKEAVSIINQINDGLGFILSHGYCQPDHKLENVLYTRKASEIDVVVSDLGGLIRIDEKTLQKHLKKYKNKLEKEGITKETALLISERQKLKLQSRAFESTPELSQITTSSLTTCPTFINEYHSILFKVLYEPDLNKLAHELKIFWEKHMVYSQAIIALILILGEEKFMPIYYEIERQKESIDLSSVLRLNGSVMMDLISKGLSQSQAGFLIQAFDFESEMRLNLELFTEAMKG